MVMGLNVAKLHDGYKRSQRTLAEATGDHFGGVFDKFYEQAAGAEEPTAEKKGAKTVVEHAGMGCSGVEAEKTDIGVTLCISTVCNDIQGDAKTQKTQKWREADSNRRHAAYEAAGHFSFPFFSQKSPCSITIYSENYKSNLLTHVTNGFFQK